LTNDLQIRFLPRFLLTAKGRLGRARSVLEAGDAAALADELHALAGEARMLDLRKVADGAILGEAAARAWSTRASGGSRAASASCLAAVNAAVAELASAPRRRPSGTLGAVGRKGKPRPKILVVDDSEIVCDSVTNMLEPRGFEVISLTSLFAFASTLSAEKPDLVLVDVSMPALDGDKLIHFSRRYHEGGPSLMVLFSTRAKDELSELVTQCGAAGYIQKTGDAERLQREVEAFLRPAR
jgi:CheY-like chemotaxis protein